MFFVLSKILDLAVAPLEWAMILIVIGLIVRPPRDDESRRRRILRKAARVAPWVGLALLWIFSLEAVGNRLTLGLETPRIETYDKNATYDAVILLGGMTDPRVGKDTGEPAFEGGVERMLAAYEALRTGHAKIVIVTDANQPEFEPNWNETEVVAAQLEAWGIAKDRIVLEQTARNTRENALRVAEIVRARNLQKLLLVTSAFHMPRALGCFEAIGLHPDAHSVDFRGYDAKLHESSWTPRAWALADTSAALREYLGRFVYRFRGWSTR